MKTVTSLKDFARSQGRSEKTIRRLIKKKAISYIKVNGRYGFLQEHIDDFLRRHCEVAESTSMEVENSSSDDLENFVDASMRKFAG